MERIPPIGYELNPLSLKKGANKVTLKIENIAKDILYDVTVMLYSVDNTAIQINDSAQTIGELKPNETKEATFNITAYLPTDVYARITAHNKKPLKWESSVIYLTVPETKIPEDEQALG